MNLNDEQKKVVEGWVKEGCNLSEIQKRLTSELNINMMYMDVRFLVLDLGLTVKDKAESAKSAKGPQEQSFAADEGLGAGDGFGGSGVSVDIDRVMKPGSLVSGTVRFSDGVSAAWTLDQAGRLGLKASTPGYRPSQEDLQSFQEEIKATLEKRGF